MRQPSACTRLARSLFVYPPQLQVPVNRIEPTRTYQLLFEGMQVLGYILCNPTQEHGEHVHIVGLPRPKTPSGGQHVDRPATNEPSKFHCLTLLAPSSAETILRTLEELTAEQLVRLAEA